MSASTEKLRAIDTLESLVDYLRDDMGWPIEAEDFDDVVFEYTAEELGIDDENAAKIESIQRLRPLTANQPWGVFFVEFEPKKLPVTTLRRILKEVVTAKRASASKAERVTWNMEDLMFVSAMGGDGSERAMNFAHFSEGDEGRLPSLKVVAWDSDDTPLHMEDVSEKLTEKLAWPDNVEDAVTWREAWSSAFTLHHGQVIRTSQQLAVLLADLARDIHDRILATLEAESGDGPITDLLAAFKKVLLHDLDDKGFADMYAQTIAYGLLSARIVNPNSSASRRIDLPITNPFLRELMDEFLHVGGDDAAGGGAGIDFDELGVNEIVDLLDNTDMEAVVTDFGDKNPNEDPVIRFYEGFLHEYDAELKTKRGVFYTPRPVVSFIVRSVDETLQKEFGLVDGLADTTTWGEMVDRFDDIIIPDSADADQPFVRILDPATGTGTFLVEAIDVVHHNLNKRWSRDGKTPAEIAELWNEYVPSSLLPRLFGYELLMAPYAIAHLKVGLKLLETGYRFESDERAHIYLTNALEPAMDPDSQFEFALPALAHEAEAVDDVKRVSGFTVVLGNPPYSLYSANMTEEANQLIADFRFINGEKVKERGALQLEKNLQDDYVKFYGLALKLLQHSGSGVLSYISNHGYINNRSLRGMRHTLLSAFPFNRIVELNGSVTRRSEEAAVAADQNVFDIQQGVAVSLFAKAPWLRPTCRHTSVLGVRTEKYAWLTGQSLADTEWRRVDARAPLYLFEPRDAGIEDEYLRGTPLDEIFGLFSTGIVTARDSLVLQFSPSEIQTVAAHMAKLPEAEAREMLRIPPDTKDWTLSRARLDIAEALDDGAQPAPIVYRPFDERWTYYTGNARGFMCNPRRPVMEGMAGKANIALCSTRQVNSGYKHAFVASGLIESCIVSTASRETGYVFPLYRPAVPDGLFARSEQELNMSDRWIQDLAAGLYDGAEGGALDPEAALAYIYALLNSETYRARYEDVLRSDFPRIPIVLSSALASDLITLGSRLVEIHLEPLLATDPTVQVLGHPPLRIEKVRFADGVVWLDNGQSYGFEGVSAEAWDYRIGGYRVLEKWCKGRQPRGGRSPRPGVVLSAEDCKHFRAIEASIRETVSLVEGIENAIERHGGWIDAVVGT